jgi:hypothetical protein
MGSNPSHQPHMIGMRLVLAACGGVATVGGVHLSDFLALAALDGGEDLSAVVFYGIPGLSSFLFPILVVLGLRLERGWRATVVGLGGAIGATVAILTLARPEWPAAWLFGLPALGTLVGTFVWRPEFAPAPGIDEAR